MSRERSASLVAWAHLAATVYLGPLLSLALLRNGWRRAGAGVLVLAMTGALVYGVAYHYVLDTPDHVAHVTHAAGGARAAAFRATALAVAVLEALGTLAGALLWPRSVAVGRATASD